MKEQYNDTKAGDTISIYSYMASSKAGAGNFPLKQPNMGKKYFYISNILTDVFTSTGRGHEEGPTCVA